ncbi:MAG: CRTAC1 family protein [Acidobacteria bacterium]|nr:CRTAC1 family protein [Acidobacteriota bacterium]
MRAAAAAGLFVITGISVLAPQSGPVISFRDVARASGLEFTLDNSPTPDKQLIETMPGGVVAFDYDADGQTDIFFTNGAAIPSLEKESPKYWNRLYRNLGGMKFRDVTGTAGLRGAGYSMAAAAADYDNDGRVDLFVAGVRRNLLYRNRGGGVFEDVTVKAGISSEYWSVAAGWFDFDNDGLLDLFVVNYLDWSLSNNPFCGDPVGKIRVYCHPRLFAGTPNTLYRNRGDGTFEDVSKVSGIGQHIGKGMSVGFADYDSDGFADVYVTNDHLPNFLFRNLGNGRFEETALLAGSALLDSGKPVSSMGVDFRDYDNDGLPDVLVTALSGETFPIFRNAGKSAFSDASYTAGLAPLSRKYSGWGVGFVDLDNDGSKDIFAANSHVNDRVELFEAARYKEHNAVFVNMPGGKFRDVSAAAGPDFRVARAHRGCAFADFNNDGRIDVVVSSLGEPAELWENITAGSNHWLRLKLTGTKSNRDGIGARVQIGNQVNLMTTAVGYASSSHYGVHFGLGKAAQAETVVVLWPGGIRQTLRNVAADQVLEVPEPAN